MTTWNGNPPDMGEGWYWCRRGDSPRVFDGPMRWTKLVWGGGEWRDICNRPDNGTITAYHSTKLEPPP